MDVYGNAYEILEGANQDCLDRVLNLNNINANSEIKDLTSKVKNLVNKGWVSNINIKRAAKTLEKLKEAERKTFLKVKDKLDLNGERYSTGNKVRIGVFSKSDGRLVMEITNIDMRLIDSAVVKITIANAIAVLGRKVSYKIMANRPDTMIIDIKPFGKGTDMKKFIGILKPELNLYLRDKALSNKELRAGGGVIKNKGKRTKTAPSDSKQRNFNKSYGHMTNSEPLVCRETLTNMAEPGLICGEMPRYEETPTKPYSVREEVNFHKIAEKAIRTSRTPRSEYLSKIKKLSKPYPSDTKEIRRESKLRGFYANNIESNYVFTTRSRPIEEMDSEAIVETKRMDSPKKMPSIKLDKTTYNQT